MGMFRWLYHMFSAQERVSAPQATLSPSSSGVGPHASLTPAPKATLPPAKRPGPKMRVVWTGWTYVETRHTAAEVRDMDVEKKPTALDIQTHSCAL